MRRALALALLAAALAVWGCPAPDDVAPASAGAPPEGAVWIEAGGDDRSVAVLARLSAELAEDLPEGPVDERVGRGLLALRLADSRGPSVAVLGRYERTGEVLRFVPAVPLQPATRYLATLALPGGGSTTAEYATSQAPDAPPPLVETVDPTVAEIPANLLRFHVTFSAPMAGGEELWRHVALVDRATGQPVRLPWREVELWSPDRTRVTLLVHPGRVKRGIRFAEELGPVLLAGRTYELVISPGLLDAAGRPLAEESRTLYRVVEADLELPVPDRWAVAAPRAGTQDPVELRFDEAMDAELLRTRIGVGGPDGRAVAGSREIAAGARTWRLNPEHPWSPGPHRLALSGELEDLAGNTSTRPFDRPIDRPPGGAPVRAIAFDVRF